MTDIYEIAKEVEAGKWGNTAAEKKASLSEAGYDYTEIKKCIKELKNKEPKEEVVEEQKQPEVVTLNIVKEPEVISRGLIYNNEAQKLIFEAREIIKDALENVSTMENDLATVKNNVRKQLANYFYKKMKRRPMILTIIVEN